MNSLLLLQFNPYRILTCKSGQQSSMFNPNKFSVPNRSIPLAASLNSSKLVIENSKQPKSRWDQPITVPSVLYSKFNMPLMQQPKQKHYPHSLIEYIKRAYQNCQTNTDKRAVESQLKSKIAQNKSRIFQIQWETQPLPQIPKIEQKKKLADVNLPKHYKLTNNTQQQQQKPSKAKIKAQKTLQKLQQKLKQKQSNDYRAPQPLEKKFIGFKSDSQPNSSNLINSKSTPYSTEQLNRQHYHGSLPFSSTSKSSQNASHGDKFIAFGNNELSITKDKEKMRKDLNKNQQKNAVRDLKEGKKLESKQQNSLKKRFAQFNRLKVEQGKNPVEMDDQINDIPIVGKSTSMEKPYLRITGRADPQTVRPESVLKKVLVFLLQKYRNGKPYDYILQQFKSLRQDLTVQHIRNSFTVRVYEQNLKISLFQNDNLTFKQYLSNLWQLYRQGIYDTKTSRDNYISNYLLALLMQERYKQFEYNLTFLEESTMQSKQVKAVLKLKKALRIGNFRAFFQFYNPRNDMTRSLLFQYIEKIRMKYLIMACKTFGEKMPLQALVDIVDDDQDQVEALIKQQGGVIRDKVFFLKESYQNLLKSQILTSKKTLTLDS